MPYETPLKLGFMAIAAIETQNFNSVQRVYLNNIRQVAEKAHNPFFKEREQTDMPLPQQGVNTQYKIQLAENAVGTKITTAMHAFTRRSGYLYPDGQGNLQLYVRHYLCNASSMGLQLDRYSSWH